MGDIEQPKKRLSRREFLKRMAGTALVGGDLATEKNSAEAQEKGYDSLTKSAMELFGIQSPEEQKKKAFEFLDDLKSEKGPLHFRRYREEFEKEFGTKNKDGTLNVEPHVREYLMDWWGKEMKGGHPFVEYEESQ